MNGKEHTSKAPAATLDRDTPDTVRLSVAAAAELGMTALNHLGYTSEEAQIIVGHLIDSALCGYSFAGLPRILAIAKNRKSKEQRYPVRIVRETAASALVDGGNNVGYLAAYRAADIGIEKTGNCGISVVGVHNTYYSGRGAYYVEKMVNAGLVVIHGASAQPKVVAPGAARAVLGTNPLCIGFPSKAGPVVFDMGTAAMMGGELSLYQMLGKVLPAGLAFDHQGRPTRDAAEALKGGVTAFGGHKGYGLSFCVQALGLLAGAALAHGTVKDYGLIFLAIRPDILLPQGAYEEYVSELVREIKQGPKQPGVDEIRVPFERSVRERNRRRVEGIVIERSVFDALRRI